MAPDKNKAHVPTVSELRRERERNEMRERIMDAARTMFVCDGYESVTLRKIANAIEYSQAVIYQYFTDKQALISAILQQDKEDLHKHMLECMTIENPVEKLIEMARLYAEWGVSHPNHYLLMLVPPPSWGNDNKRTLYTGEQSLEQEMLAVLYATVEAGIKRGMLKEEYADPSLVATTLWAGIHGTVMLEITMTPEDRALLGNQDMPFARRFDMLKKVFVDGFLKAR